MPMTGQYHFIFHHHAFEFAYIGLYKCLIGTIDWDIYYFIYLLFLCIRIIC